MSDVDLDQLPEEESYPAEGQWENAPTVGSEEDSPTTPLEIEQAEVNFTETREVSSEALKDVEAAIAFVAENPKTVNKVLEKYADVLDALGDKKDSLPEAERDWLTALIVGLTSITMHEAPIGATERPESQWTQGVKGNDPEVMMRPGKPLVRFDRNKKHSPEDLSIYLSSKSGFGVPYDCYLPDAGLWLRLRSPSLSEIVSLQTDLGKERINLGMETKSLAFSNASAVLLNAVTTLALNCVVKSNCNYLSAADLEERISIYDESLLHHALACTMYPDSFNYKVPCIADPSKCNSVIERKLNVSSIVWYDDLSFNADQRKFMSGRFTRINTNEEFDAYRKASNDNNERIYWIGDIGLKLHIPSVGKRKETAEQWRASLIEMSKGVFNEPPHGSSRSAFIDELSQRQTALQYAHFVVGIYERDSEVVDIEDCLISNDSEVITNYVRDVLSSGALVEQYFETVQKFINDSVKAIIALPSHQCTNCDTVQGVEHSRRFPHLIPLDTLQVFFTLAAQKTAQ